MDSIPPSAAVQLGKLGPTFRQFVLNVRRKLFAQNNSLEQGIQENEPNVDSLGKHTPLPNSAKLNKSTASNASVTSHVPESTHEATWIERQNKEAIDAIEDSAFVKLLVQHQGLHDLSGCRVVRRAEGSYNHCRILELEGYGRYAIKVPLTGTTAFWEAGDASNLRSEAQTMNYIRRKTGIPIPEVLAWDDGFSNAITAPFILMRAVEGKPAYSFWVEHHPDGSIDFLNADTPSPRHAQKRKNFLKSLAHTMAKLQDLTFDKIGMLNFDENSDAPIVGSSWIDVGTGTLKERPAYSSSAALFQAKMNDLQARQEAKGEAMADFYYGIIAFLTSAFSTFPLCSSTQTFDDQETFVLAHNDLDLQNIFVDDDGNIVGLIDWDMCTTVPRCVGYSSVPVFLRRDYDSDYDIENTLHMPWFMQAWRKHYSQYMIEATSFTNDLGDGVFSYKSGLYHMAYDIENNGVATPFFIERLFKLILCLQAVDQQSFLERLGGECGWSSAESMLKEEFKMLFTP